MASMTGTNVVRTRAKGMSPFVLEDDMVDHTSSIIPVWVDRRVGHVSMARPRAQGS